MALPAQPWTTDQVSNLLEQCLLEASARDGHQRNEIWKTLKAIQTLGNPPTILPYVVSACGKCYNFTGRTTKLYLNYLKYLEIVFRIRKL